MKKRIVAIIFAGLLTLSAFGSVSVSAGSNNGPPPCQGKANPGCSGPGGS